MPATAAAWTVDARSMGMNEGGRSDGTCKHNILETEGSQDPRLFAAMPRNIPTVVVIVP